MTTRLLSSVLKHHWNHLDINRHVQASKAPKSWIGIVSTIPSKRKTDRKAQSNLHLSRLFTISRRVYENANTAPVYVEWATRSEVNRQAQNRPRVANNDTYTLVTVSRRTNSRWLSQIRNLEDSSTELDGARTNQMGFANCFQTGNDGNLRFCADYRRRKALTSCHSWPLPRMEEWIYTLVNDQVLSTLDKNCSYWFVEVVEADNAKTVFNFHLWLG